MKHSFVEFIPESLEEDVLYVALEFGTVIHHCACGCGNQVVTPLSPTDWSLAFDGETISLRPSIGNWNLPCRSHYWIRNGEFVWAASWTDTEVTTAQAAEQVRKAEHFAARDAATTSLPRPSIWVRLGTWFDRLLR